MLAQFFSSFMIDKYFIVSDTVARNTEFMSFALPLLFQFF
jgi:hypothetical protein